MKLKIVCVSFILFLIAASCDECKDCGPVLNDPSFLVEFHAKSAKRTARVSLDTINGLTGIAVDENFEDAAALFRLPLDAGEDMAQYELSVTEFSADIPDTLQYERSLTVSYDRETYVDNGNIRIRAVNFNVVNHNFDSLVVDFANSVQISNETKVKLYL